MVFLPSSTKRVPRNKYALSKYEFLVCFNLACSACAVKYQTSIILYKPRPMGLVFTKKNQTSRSVNKKLLYSNSKNIIQMCSKFLQAYVSFLRIPHL